VGGGGSVNCLSTVDVQQAARCGCLQPCMEAVLAWLSVPALKFIQLSIANNPLPSFNELPPH
jgi:hypothetical protein